MEEEFDLQAWKNQGENQIKSLEDREEKLLEELESVRSKKAEIEIALGKTRSHAPGGKGKFMLKGIIKQVLMENESPAALLTQDGVIEAVQNIKAGSSEQAIRRSLDRLVKGDKNFGYSVSGGINLYYYGPNTNEKSNKSNGKDISAPNLVQGG